MTVMLMPNRIGPTQVTYRPARSLAGNLDSP